MAEYPDIRPSAEEIYDRIEADAAKELERSARQLMFSGLGAGLAMGISGFAVAVARDHLDVGKDSLVPWLLYPLGFIIVIVGRQQLFTENTLTPVTFVLRRRAKGLQMLRLWGVVLASNLVGALAIAALAMTTTAMSPGVEEQLALLGKETVDQPAMTIFWTAVVAGWIIALVTWLVTAASTTLGQVVIIFGLTFVVGAGHFTHSIAGASEAFSAAIAGEIEIGDLFVWLGLALVGNTLGGVVMVALFNYGQVAKDDDERDERSLKERSDDRRNGSGHPQGSSEV